MIMLLNPGKKRKRRRSFRRRGGWSCSMIKRCHRRKRSTRAYFGRAARLAAKTSAIPFGGGSIPVAANRRRRRGRNPSFNYRRKRRNYSHWIPAYRNPGAGIIGASTTAFNTNLIKSALPVIGGVIGARFVTEKLAGISALPSFLKSGFGSYALALVGAGLAYTGSKMVLPKYAKSVLFGGSIYVMTQLMNRYVFPKLGFTPMLTGMGSYLTVADAANARALNGLGYDEMDGLGDYLTPANAAGARPLFGMGHMTSEELAGLAYGGMSAVENIAGEELE